MIFPKRPRVKAKVIGKGCLVLRSDLETYIDNLIGTRNSMSAAITDITKSLLSIKNTYIVTLTFDDDSLPNHLKTRQLTVYNELLEACEAIEF